MIAGLRTHAVKRAKRCTKRVIQASLVLISGAALLVTVYKTKDSEPGPADLVQHYEYSGNDSHQIMFIETSGSGVVSLRFLSSVESAARYNPKKSIVVYLISDKRPVITDTMKAVQDQLTNVHYVHLTGESAFNNSGLEQWYANYNGVFRTEHLSDALRYVLLYRDGNIYLDLDVLSMKELHLPMNALLAEVSIYQSLTGSVMVFARGHPFLQKLINRIPQINRKMWYVGYGPDLLFSQYKEYCAGKGDQCDVSVIPEHVASPTGWAQMLCFFQEQCTDFILEKTKDNMIVHWYNKVNAFLSGIYANRRTGYLKLVERHAPITFAAIQKVGYVP